jgi:uncharacterized membrane protein
MMADRAEFRARRLAAAGLKLACGIAVLAITLALMPQPAHAAYTFCNRTSYVLASAIGTEAGVRTESHGWFVLQPGQCQVVLKEPLHSRVYYTFAYTLPVHSGGVRNFAGNRVLCSGPGLASFAIVGQEDCERRGYVARKFATIRIANTTDWTTTFTEPTEYTLEEARVAGVQRLLADIGLDAGDIDGYLGAKTRRALVNFKEEHGIAPDLTLPNALYDALVNAAQQTHEDVGYSFCNDTGDVVWAAIGYESDGEIVATGWFRVDSRRCAKVIKGRLSESIYYTFAETEQGISRHFVWGGDRPLCTMDNRFTIREHKDCEKRGYVTIGFARIEVGKEPGYVQRLTPESASKSRGASR